MKEDEAWAEWQPTSSDSTSGRSDTVHYLAKYILRSSVVLQAAYGRFRSHISYDIVLGKETSIELVVIGEDGILRSVCEQTVFGIIKDIVVLFSSEKNSCIPFSQGRDLLAVLSDSGKLSFLMFNAEMDRFCAVTHVEVSPAPGNTRHQLGRMLASDSNGCFIAVSAYEDELALVSISALDCKEMTEKNYFDLLGSKGSLSPVQFPPGTIWSISFVSRDDHLLTYGHMPIVAVIMHRNGFGMINELLLFSRYEDGDTLIMFSAYSVPGTLSLSIIDVPHISGFALLFRLGDIILMNLTDPSKPHVAQKINLDFLREVEEYVDEASRGSDIDDEGISARALLELREYDPMCIDNTTRPDLKLVCSWSWEPSGSPKLLISLDTGDLHLLDIHLEQEKVAMSCHGPVFNCFPCKTLVWTRGGFVAGFVEMGDGKVLKVENESFCASTPIQNIAPILDVSHNEKTNSMYACCGVGSEGSLRIVESGVHVENLLSTAPNYVGITGLWALHMKATDCYHSFLVLSFVEETRILLVGSNFLDVSDDVGFKTNTCTLSCGLVSDRMLVQIYPTGVRVCLPASSVQVEGIFQSGPIIKSWHPDNMSISRGAIGNDMIVIATSNPCCLIILAIKHTLYPYYEIYGVQKFDMHHEISCISIPDMSSEHEYLSVSVDQIQKGASSNECKISKTFVIGTHKPSMEILSITPEGAIKVLAVGETAINSTFGIPLVGCIPEDVRFVLVDKCYLLSGLRNGMILRFELPAALLPTLSRHTPAFSLPHSTMNKVNSMMPFKLELIAIRRIGTTPVFLIPLHKSLDSDIIALCQRPWLFQSARHTLAYTSVSFEHATHVTPVNSVEFPEGILYASENKLHLIEMDQSKRLNGKKFHLGGTPRKVLYHKESKTLLVMRIGLISSSYSSDICCIDPLSGSVLSKFKLELGETGKCMQIMKVGDEEVLVVGTSQTSDSDVMPNGESESAKGRLVVLTLQNTNTSDLSSLVLCSNSSSSSQNIYHIREVADCTTEQLSSSSHSSSPDDNAFEAVQCDEAKTGQLKLIKAKSFPGVIMCISPYLDRYFLISAGNILCVFGFLNGNPRRLRRFASIRTRFMITCVNAYLTRIAVGDCRDGILYFSYDEANKKLEQLYCDPKQRLMADCLLLNSDTAAASDRKGSISVLSCVDYVEDNANPECNLAECCAFYVGETIMTIRKGSFSNKLSVDDGSRGCVGQATSANTFIGTTLLGSIMVFLPIRSEVYELLKIIQTTLACHPLTAPVLGNDHHEFRQRESTAEVPSMLDGDMLAQFLELTHVQQQSVLSQITVPVTLAQLVQLLEQIHHALS